MKTLDNGCPQFDADKEDHFSGAEIDYLNTQLREWHESRRCMNCRHLVLQEPGFEDVARCNKVLIWFYKTSGPVPSTFSCQAFQEKK